MVVKLVLAGDTSCSRIREVSTTGNGAKGMGE